MVADDPPQPGHDRVHVGVGPHPRGVEEQLLAPTPARRRWHSSTTCSKKRRNTPTPRRCRMLAQGGVVGQRLVQGVAQVPAVGQVEAGRLHQLALAAQPLEEQDQLELEEDHRVEARSPDPGVAVADQLAHEGEVERRLQVAVEVPRRHQVLQRRPAPAGRRGAPSAARASAASSRRAPTQQVRGRAAAAAARPSAPGWRELLRPARLQRGATVVIFNGKRFSGALDEATSPS